MVNLLYKRQFFPIDPNKYNQLTSFIKDETQFNGENIAFSTNSARKPRHPHAKINQLM